MSENPYTWKHHLESPKYPQRKKLVTYKRAKSNSIKVLLGRREGHFASILSFPQI
jgi:hypothetical protein